MDSPSASKRTTTTRQTPFPVSGNLCKLLMCDTGNEMGKFPTKPKLLEPPETSLNTSPTPHPSQTTSPAKGFPQSKQKNNNSGSTQSKGSTSKQKKSTTPDLSSKPGKDGMLTPQE